MDVASITFGLLCLGLGVLLHIKRGKITGGGKGGGKFTIPVELHGQIVLGLMLFGGVGLAATFIGDWLAGMNFSVGDIGSRPILIITAGLVGLAVFIDMVNGKGIKVWTYAMGALFPSLWAAAGGSLSWPRAVAAVAWSWLSGTPV